MTHEELDRLWFQAMEESIKDGEMVVRYHFAALVASAERERILEMCKEGLWDGEVIRYHLNKQKDNT